MGAQLDTLRYVPHYYHAKTTLNTVFEHFTITFYLWGLGMHPLFYLRTCLGVGVSLRDIWLVNTGATVRANSAS